MSAPKFLSRYMPRGGDAFSTLHVATGKIVVCDPLADPDRDALTRSVPPGDYPVFLHIDDDEERIALAELSFTTGTPVKWEMATLDGQDVNKLERGFIFGYPVDAGMGCFMDVEGQKAMLEHEAQLQKERGEEYISYYDDVIDPLLYENEDSAADDDRLDLHPFEDREDNVILFQSGWGDGVYASWWGLDAQDHVVCLVTSFGLWGGEDEDDN